MAEQEFLTRRQLRELERLRAEGIAAESTNTAQAVTAPAAAPAAPVIVTPAPASPQPVLSQPASAHPAPQQPVAVTLPPAPVTPPAPAAFSSRRQLRQWQVEHETESPVASVPTERLDVVPTPRVYPTPSQPAPTAGVEHRRDRFRPEQKDETPARVFALLPEDTADSVNSPARPSAPTGQVPVSEHAVSAAAPAAVPVAPVIPELPTEPASAPEPARAPEPTPAPVPTPAPAQGAPAVPSFRPPSDHDSASHSRAVLWTSSTSLPGEDTDGSNGIIVLPDLPTEIDVTSPLDETGEVMLTGTITLPAQVGATGVIPTGFQESDELDDHGYAIGNSNRPVSVSSVVAEATSGRVLPETRSSKRVTIALSIVAGVLFVAAIGMLAYYFLSGVR